MASRKTWIWIVVGGLSVVVVALLAAAGAGIYFVSRHVDIKTSSSADALRTLDEARARFGDDRPLFQLDSSDQPRPTKAVHDLPSSPIKATSLWILAWHPVDEKLIRVQLPFWLLRTGHRKFEVHSNEHRFDLQQLDLDVGALERIGPALVFDLRQPSGERVLIWTQ